MMDQVQRVWHHVLGIVRGYSAITRVDDSGPMQVVQLAGGEGRDAEDVPVIGLYGFASHPPQHARAFTIAMNGDPSQQVVVGTVDTDTRKKDLPEGAVCLYHKDGETYVILDDGRECRINAARVIIEADEVEIKGKLKVSGDIETNGDVRAGAVSLKNHRHPETGGTTGTPV